MKVPYFDLKQQYATLRDEILAAVDRVSRNASFILGEEVAQFEKEFAAYCGTKYCVGLNSGTSALHLALLAAGIKAGDEVITTSNTFIATAEAISYTGAKPVFVDVDPATANIDPNRIERAVTKRTKAIIPVHLYGRPADLDPILALAKHHNLVVIEDACQAHGARYRGRRVGGFGQAAAFSFYPGKNLGAYGEGGALTTNDERMAQFAIETRNHGQARRYYHDRIGYNYRMDGFQGAVLRVKLRHLDEWTAKRQEFARRYRELLGCKQTVVGTALKSEIIRRISDCPAVRSSARDMQESIGAPGGRALPEDLHKNTGGVQLPQDDPQNESVYHLFVVYVDDRDAVRAALEARGVETAIHYPVPVHLQKAYADLGYEPGSLPHTERACARVFSMPLFPEMTTGHVEFAATSLAETAAERAKSLS